MNCWVSPAAIDGLAGVTAMLCRVADVTVSTVEPLTSPSVALMLDVPAATPWASPVVAPMVATELVAEAQVTEPVMTAVVASEYVPVATNCWFGAGRDRGVGRRDRDALQGRDGDRQDGRAADEPEGGADAEVPTATPWPGRSRRSWPSPAWPTPR